MDKYIRQEFKKVFPGEWVEIPFDHPIYHQNSPLIRGCPRSTNTMIFLQEDLGFSTKEARLLLRSRMRSRRWLGGFSGATRDPEEVRLLALQMGANLVQYAG